MGEGGDAICHGGCVQVGKASLPAKSDKWQFKREDAREN